MPAGPGNRGRRQARCAGRLHCGFRMPLGPAAGRVVRRQGKRRIGLDPGGVGVGSDGGLEGASRVVSKPDEMCPAAPAVRTSESGNRHAAPGREKPADEPALVAAGQGCRCPAIVGGQMVHVPVLPLVRGKVARHAGADAARAAGVSAIGICAFGHERVAETADRESPRRSDREVESIGACRPGKAGQFRRRPSRRPKPDEQAAGPASPGKAGNLHCGTGLPPVSDRLAPGTAFAWQAPGRRPP